MTTSEVLEIVVITLIAISLGIIIGVSWGIVSDLWEKRKERKFTDHLLNETRLYALYPMPSPKKAEDYIEPRQDYDTLLNLWIKGYKMGYSQKAMIPESEVSTPITDLSFDKIRGDLKRNANVILGESNGREFRDSTASPDPMTRYLESIGSIIGKDGEFQPKIADFVDNFDDEFFPHIKKLSNDSLADLVRNKLMISEPMAKAIQKESLARILKAI